MRLYPVSTGVPETNSKTDTSRSWRALKKLFPLCVATIFALVFFLDRYSSLTGGLASPSEVAVFDGQLKEFIREADGRKIASLSLPSGYYFSTSAPIGMKEEAKRLESATQELGYDNQDMAKAIVKLAFDEYNSRNGSPRLEFTSEELDHLANRGAWKTRDTLSSIFSVLGSSIFVFICTYLSCYLLVILIAFSWWFLMDRLRDISKAIRG